MKRAAQTESAPQGPDGSTSDADEIRRRIMDVAEVLFAEEGYKRVGLRQLTTKAEVNVAAVNYYFGSKLDLLEAVFRRRAEPINAERKARFADYRAAIGDGLPEVEPVLAAFIEPTLRAGRMGPGGNAYRLLMGRMSTNPDPEVRQILFDIFDEVGSEFAALLRRALPHLDRDDFYWRLACVIGTMQYVLADNGRVRELAGSDFSLADVDQAMAYLIPFLAAGLKAPASPGPVQPARVTRRSLAV